MTDIVQHHTDDMNDLITFDALVDKSYGTPRPPKKQSREEIEMARMTYDGLLLQSQLAFGETRELAEIAQAMFCREGEEASKVAMNRARSAMLNLVTMRHAKPLPNKKEMTHIVSIASTGTQLAALMNINTRRAEQGRREDRRNQEDGEKLVLGDSPGIAQV